MGAITPSTCQGCLANCPVLIETQDNTVMGIKGNPAGSATHGAVCPNIHIAAEQLDDPDRLLYPMRRTNPLKGRNEQPHFERISWEEAINTIAERLMVLRERKQTHRVVFAKGRATGISDIFLKVFSDIYGTPNKITHDGICATAEKLATCCLDGVFDYHDYDLRNTQYVLLWGTDPLVGNRMKPFFLSEMSNLQKCATITVIDPHRSLTAEKSHHWLSVLPGTDAALACAMAHVILTEGLWSRTYVGDFCDQSVSFIPGRTVDPNTFKELHTHGLITWWNEALKDASPTWAESKCGIDAQTIRSIAREFARAESRAISWISPGITMCAQGLYTGMACYALNGLVGSIGSLGGVCTFPSAPINKLPDTTPFQDDIARTACTYAPVDQRDDFHTMAADGAQIHASQITNRLADAILEEKPYKLDTVIAYWVNWAYSCTGAQRWEQALSKLPFFVHITTNLSETSHFADIVLPARHHLFEDWGFARSRQNGTHVISLEQPSVESPGQCRGDETEFPYDLACALAERGFEAPLRYYETLIDPCTGKPPSGGRELGEITVKHMLLPYWCESNILDSSSEKQRAWDAFCATGVWNSPQNKPRSPQDSVEPLPTPSGCFEFASEKLRALIEDFAAAHCFTFDEALDVLGYQSRGEQAFVPHYEPPLRFGESEEFPFIFAQHRSRLSLEGRSANTRRFQELKGTDPGDEPWDDVLKINPDDMTKLGLQTGDTIKVTSVQGSITCHAKAWDGTRTGVVVKCYGQGHWAYGAIAAVDFSQGIPRGGNNNEIIPAAYEPASGATARHGGLTRVRIEKV